MDVLESSAHGVTCLRWPLPQVPSARPALPSRAAIGLPPFFRVFAQLFKIFLEDRYTSSKEAPVAMSLDTDSNGQISAVVRKLFSVIYGL